MKNQMKAIIFAIALAVIIGLLVEQSVYADDSQISSKGNFVFVDGERVAIYADDIIYLQWEIEKLFNEISSEN